MKIHPLFAKVIVNLAYGFNSEEMFNNWRDAGMPMVEEEPCPHDSIAAPNTVGGFLGREDYRCTRCGASLGPRPKDFPFPIGNGFINLRGTINLDTMPELRQAIMDGPKKDARIRELEALVSHQRGRIERMATAGVADDKRIRELEAQLPEQMKHCTIRYVECPVGHGRLTATNWVDVGCQRCEIMELEAKLARRNSSLSELTVPGYEDQIRNAALEEAAKACWPHQQFNPESGSETLLMQIAARIRALKKETK